MGAFEGEPARDPPLNQLENHERLTNCLLAQSLIRPSFTKLRMSDSSLFESHFQNLLAVLPPANPVSGMVDIDLQPLIFRMTLDSATEVLLGRSFNSLLEPPGSPSLRFMEALTTPSSRRTAGTSWTAVT
jgi:hypothetical protein